MPTTYYAWLFILLDELLPGRCQVEELGIVGIHSTVIPKDNGFICITIVAPATVEHFPCRVYDEGVLRIGDCFAIACDTVSVICELD